MARSVNLNLVTAILVDPKKLSWCCLADYKFGDITKRVIRDMTGNKDYELGDGSKAVASATTDAAEAAAQAVIDAGGTAVEAGAAAKKALDDSGYQFGDITKGAVKSFEQAVRDSTGNEECARPTPTCTCHLPLTLCTYGCR